MTTSNVYLTVLAVFVAFATPLLVAVVNHFQQSRAAQRERRAARVAEQLQRLYGPASFYADHIRYVTDQFAAIERVAQTTPLQPEPPALESDPYHVHPRYRAFATILERYSDRLTDTRRALIDVIQANYALCEPRDIDLMQHEVLSAVRRGLEEGLPLDLMVQVPIASRPELAAELRKRFNELFDEFNRLSGAP